MSVKRILALLKQGMSLIAPQMKKADSVHGVKELIEALRAAGRITVFLFKRFKDGADIGDGWALMKKLVTDEDPEFKKVIEDGYEGANKIPDEVKDMDVGEGLEVACAAMDVTEQIIDAAAEPKPAAYRKLAHLPSCRRSTGGG